jgi:hypothetical protein
MGTSKSRRCARWGALSRCFLICCWMMLAIVSIATWSVALQTPACASEVLEGEELNEIDWSADSVYPPIDDELETPVSTSQPRLGPRTAPRAGSPLRLGSSERRLGGPRGPQASAPPVIGDQFGGGESLIIIPLTNITGLPNAQVFITPGGQVFTTPFINVLVIGGIDGTGSGAAVLGTTKLAENGSPLPRDRVFFNYSMFDDTSLIGGQDVNRFSPGFEKTFGDELYSVEMRFPFAATINPDLIVSGDGLTTDDAVFGNIATVFKALLYQTETIGYSAGIQVTAPTAPALTVSLANGTRLLAVDNESVHLMPFVGMLHTPNDRFFSQAFVQVDVDANGNPVSINPQVQGQNLVPIGRLSEATYLYADLSVGYWLHRCADSHLTGIAPTIELHYNTTLETSESIRTESFLVGDRLQQVSNLNLTLGCYFEFVEDNSLVVGYTAPIGNSADHQFDGELRAFFTHRFGTTSRMGR